MNMNLDRSPVSADDPFVLEDLKLHARVAHDDEDTAIRKIGATVAAEFEQFAQVALLTQDIRVQVFDVTLGDSLRLPVAPLAEGAGVAIQIDGLAFSGFELSSGLRPYIRWLPEHRQRLVGNLIIDYRAGFGSTASDIPSDIAQAIMDQATVHYDARGALDAKSLTTSPHMARVGARYRGVQV